jgi:tripartite-type tricarboxylate transporter receptor subunit TctC
METHVLSRRSLVAAGLLAPVVARAQPAASNIIRVINPFAAGGTSDAMARLLQPSLQQRLGATIIVENRPRLGLDRRGRGREVAARRHDLVAHLRHLRGQHAPSQQSALRVQKDFEPVTMIARGPMVLTAHPARPFKSLPELVAVAKARPGVLTYCTTGIGSNGHLTMAALCQLTDIKLVHVPYRGAAPVLNDGTAGHVDMVISSSATMAPQIESGQLHPVVQFGDKRLSFLPDTATAIEQGITSLHAYSWFGFFRPAGTPKPVVDKFYREVSGAVREEANYNTFVNKFRSEVVLPPPDELRQMIVEELPFWGKIIRDNNIKSGAG